MNQPNSTSDIFYRILKELGEIHGELKGIAAGLADHKRIIEEHAEEIENLKLGVASRQGSSLAREKWAGRIFMVLPPVVSAVVGFGLGKLLH